MSDKQKLYLWVDSDTIVISSALSVQTNYCVYKDNEFIETCKSKLQWTKDYPDKNPDEYEFRQESRLKQNKQMCLSVCKKQIREKFQSIQSKFPDRIMIIVLEGQGNFREAIYPNYKANRSTEIILRKELSEWVGKSFPNVRYAVGQESDDVASIAMWKGYKDYLKTGVYTHIVAAVDKDLTGVAGYLYNYNTDTITEISELEADRFFCIQCLYGDSIDAINGINAPISKELSSLYGIRHSAKGVGEKTARAIMSPCKTSKECFERLIECYKDAHKDKWLEKLQLEAGALRMRHVKDEMYQIVDHFKHLGIDYESVG